MLGDAERQGYVRMMSTRADLKQFDIKQEYIDVKREERLAFVRKHAKYDVVSFVAPACVELLYACMSKVGK